jgi:hypothetical protein
MVERAEITPVSLAPTALQAPGAKLVVGHRVARSPMTVAGFEDRGSGTRNTRTVR